MRHTSFIFVLTLISCINLQGQNNNDTRLKGLIKFETRYGYEAAEKKGEIRRDTLTSKAFFRFDEKGNLVEANYFDLKTNSVFSKDKRVYDDKGNMIEITFYNQSGEVLGHDVFKYDDKNHQIEKKNFWNGTLNGISTTAYDYNSMIVAERFFDADGTLQSMFSYKIDEKGNHLEDYGMDSSLISRAKYEYNETGNKIKEYVESWEESEATNSVIVYEYDKQNNEILRTITDIPANTVSSVKTEYTYDKLGNWIKQVTTWSWNDSRNTVIRVTSDSIDQENNESIVESRGDITKAYVFLKNGDSTIYLTADMQKDHRIFGYAKPDIKSDRLILFSVFTNDVENNPFGCKLGAYYDTGGMEDLTLKYTSTTGSFVEVTATDKENNPTIVYFEKKWIIFEQ